MLRYFIVIHSILRKTAFNINLITAILTLMIHNVFITVIALRSRHSSLIESSGDSISSSVAKTGNSTPVDAPSVGNIAHCSLSINNV